MTQNTQTTRIVKFALVAAIYAALTIGLAPISYGPIQFRFSEILVLLAFFDPFYIGGLTLGCFVANMFSPMPLLDMPFGTLATFISVVSIHLTAKHLKGNAASIWIASLWPTLFNGIIIGAMLSFAFNIPLWATMLEVAFGEFVVVTIIGVPTMLLIQKRYPHLLKAHK